MAEEPVEELVVQADSILPVYERSLSSTVVSSQQLRSSIGLNMGELLNTLHGVHNNSAGSAVGVPTIRGLGRQRSIFLYDALPLGDLSLYAGEHSLGVNPLQVGSILVLRGPGALRFGSGAAGGIINVNSNLWQEGAESGFRVLGKYHQASQGRESALHWRGNNSGSLVWQLGATDVDADDYDIKNWSAIDLEDREHLSRGVMAYSGYSSDSQNLGFRWGERTRMGYEYSAYAQIHSVPGHAHHEEEHDEEEEEEEEEHHHEEEEVLAATLDMEMDRHQFNIVRDFDTGRVSGRWIARMARSEVDQVEVEVFAPHDEEEEEEEEEEEHEEHLPAMSSQKADFLRTDFEYRAGSGLGVLGLDLTNLRLTSGGETDLPPRLQDEKRALYWQHWQGYDDMEVGYGLRYETARRWSDAANISQNVFSASFSTHHHFADGHELGLQLARSGHLPILQSLFADGVHHGLGAYVRGDLNLDSEIQNSLDVTWTHVGDVEAQLSAFYYRIADYTYYAEGEEIDENEALYYLQADATIQGFDGRLALRRGSVELELTADVVNARLNDGARLPYTPPWRMGLALRGEHSAWNWGIFWQHAAAQTLPQEGQEYATPAYDRVNLRMAVPIDSGRAHAGEVFVEVRNLLDDEIRDATSSLADRIVEPQRHAVVGFRYAFSARP